MASIASLAVSITARTGGLVKGLNRANRRLTRFASGVTALGARVARLGGTILAVAGGGGFAYLTTAAYRNIDAIAKTADKLGITTERLIALRHAAKITGVEANTLDKGLQNMARNVADAAEGVGEAKQAFIDLGINAKELQDLSIDKQFGIIGDAMDKVTNQTKRVQLAYDIFGGRAVALLNTLRGGTEALNAFEADARLLGLTVSRDMAGRIEHANDSMTRMKASITGLVQTVAVRLTPVVERITAIVVGFAFALRKTDSQALETIKTTLKWVGGLAAALFIIPKVVSAMTLIVKAYKAVTASSVIMQALSGPAGWATLAAGAAIAAGAVIGVSKAFGKLKTDIMETVQQAERVGTQALRPPVPVTVTNGQAAPTLDTGTIEDLLGQISRKLDGEY